MALLLVYGFRTLSMSSGNQLQQRKPLVTALLATHNGSRFVSEAIASVLKQRYEPLELIIVDDASDDDTLRKVSAFNDPRISVLRNTTGQGLTVSLNRGLAAAQGEFIARIDDDDIWVGQEKLTKQVDFLLKHPRVGPVC